MQTGPVAFRTLFTEGLSSQIRILLSSMLWIKYILNTIINELNYHLNNILYFYFIMEFDSNKIRLLTKQEIRTKFFRIYFSPKYLYFILTVILKVKINVLHTLKIIEKYCKTKKRHHIPKKLGTWIRCVKCLYKDRSDIVQCKYSKTRLVRTDKFLTNLWKISRL